MPPRGFESLPLRQIIFLKQSPISLRRKHAIYQKYKMSNHSLYHLHRQNRIVKIRKPIFPDKWIRILDKIVMCVAILGPICTLPQIYKVWAFQNTEGLSLISWGSYLVFNFPLLLYGIIHREKIMITMYVLWIIMNTSIVLGILLFG